LCSARHGGDRRARLVHVQALRELTWLLSELLLLVMLLLLPLLLLLLLLLLLVLLIFAKSTQCVDCPHEAAMLHLCCTETQRRH